MNRFKIDWYDSSCGPYGLYVRVSSFWGDKWKFIDRFEDREKAKALYEKIKDLPEYLP